ncbi:hypothetical protein GCM10027612_66120 [Microbispora bryophytorum subsp. camponoti]
MSPRGVTVHAIPCGGMTEQRLPAAMPEKPTLDGLEAVWVARWEAQGTYRFDRSRGRDEVYSIDTPAHRVRFPSRGARLLLHAHGHDRPLPADAGARGLLPDGVGR